MKNLDPVDILNEALGNIDIYLLDQIMKGRYVKSQKILDAGCGGGRNLIWFIKNEYDVSGIDLNQAVITHLSEEYPQLKNKFTLGSLSELPYEKNEFDHVICNAVLHFAKDEEEFEKMFSELVRVLKKGGSLFIRMTSDIGIENSVIPIGNGVYDLPDGSIRFLIRRKMIDELMNKFSLSFSEPVKSLNVDGLRTMTTLVLNKF